MANTYNILGLIKGIFRLSFLGLLKIKLPGTFLHISFEGSKYSFLLGMRTAWSEGKPAFKMLS